MVVSTGPVQRNILFNGNEGLKKVGDAQWCEHYIVILMMCVVVTYNGDQREMVMTHVIHDSSSYSSLIQQS